MKPAVIAFCIVACPAIACAQPRKVDVPHSEQTIGSWLLTCATDPMTDAQTCRMRDRLWVIVPSDGHPGLALEVQQRYDQLVPAITVRDLTFSTALNGLLTLTATAQLRFDGNPMLELPCNLESTSVICGPSKSDAAAAAEQLAKARTVLVRFRAVGNLPLPIPEEPLALDLDRTQEALVRYRMAGPASEATPWIGQDLKGTMERLLRSVGVSIGPQSPSAPQPVPLQPQPQPPSTK